jgi:hypothetical protein
VALATETHNKMTDKEFKVMDTLMRNQGNLISLMGLDPQQEELLNKVLKLEKELTLNEG